MAQDLEKSHHPELTVAMYELNALLCEAGSSNRSELKLWMQAPQRARYAGGVQITRGLADDE
jgi:hypothetical protein